MRTIGIDPGTAIMGWGVVEEAGGVLSLVEYGALTTPAGMPAPDRLVLLYDGLQEVLRKHRPDTRK